MEVHHHSHHGKKKWTEYFWEFLMLFLAVFCGFLAEYQLEHKIEKDREEKYMFSMVDDLTFDTTWLASNIRLRSQRVEMVDSLIYLLSLPEYKQHTSSIYYFGRHISPPINFFPNDRTIQQLKSSGSLRLIRNIEVSNSIMAYDQKMRSYLFELTDEIELRSEYRTIAGEVFDGKIFNKMIDSNRVTRPLNDPPLFSNDPALINKVIVKAQYLKKLDQNQVVRAAEMKQQAIDLIKTIKKQYHLK
jgi:hypothetical protein